MKISQSTYSTLQGGELSVYMKVIKMMLIQCCYLQTLMCLHIPLASFQGSHSEKEKRAW